VRVLGGAPRPNGLDAWCFGSGNGRVEPELPLTLMEGTDGVTDIEGALILGPREGAGVSLIAMVGILGVTEIDGALTSRPLFGAGDSLTDMLGMGGVTPIDGTLTFEPRSLVGPLTDIDGVSETDILGIGGAGAGLGRLGAAW
jgi:hypothetical protein